MYNRFKVTLASLMFLATMAKVNQAKADDAPAMCKNLANYAAQMLSSMKFTDTQGAYGEEYNPSSIKLKSDFKNHAVGKVTDLGNCDDDSGKNLKQKWCTGFGGGSFEIYQIEIVNTDWKSPEAEVIVNYNSRGACIVREVQLPD